MGAEMPLLPGQQRRRPWWAAALLGGASAGIMIAAAMGFSLSARGNEPRVATGAIATPPPSPPPATIPATAQELMMIEEWRQFRTDIRDLRAELGTTNTEMGKLNTRLSRIEVAQGVKPETTK